MLIVCTNIWDISPFLINILITAYRYPKFASQCFFNLGTTETAQSCRYWVKYDKVRRNWKEWECQTYKEINQSAVDANMLDLLVCISSED